MIEPVKKYLAGRAAEEGKAWLYISNASGIHPNARFYKYTWYIFTLDSPWDGYDEFFVNAPTLSTAAFIAERERCRAEMRHCIIYNFRQPRACIDSPFDPTSEKWRDTKFAPALEDDTDPEWEGHK